MPARYDDERDEATEAEAWNAAEDDEDRDLPQERDLTPDESEDDLATAECPRCGHELIHDAVQCPACGEYASNEDAPSKSPPWLLAIALLLVLAFLAWALR
jgi:rubrerythrin